MSAEAQVQQPANSPWYRRLFVDRVALRSFLGVALQLGLLVAVVNQFQLETQLFHGKIMPLVFFGFLIHSVLPRRYRLGFFVALSLVTIPIALGFPESLWLIGLGLLLISLCHLPLPFSVRVALIVMVGAGMALLRAGRIETSWAGTVLPILASMFMFRIIIYLYDLRHQKAPTSLLHALAYFFMLPNIAFPLFPVVDYATFQRTHYDTEPHLIHQKGIRWILSGVIQLFIYRCINHFWVIAAEDVTDLTTLAQHAASNYLLILRVLGQFTMVIGILHLFGFNLPPIMQRLFLAAGFTDFWRRANIYWKDFMQKVFFYPVYFRLRRFGPSVALVISMVLAFVVTWILHAYQWFWIRGSYLLTLPDLLFWAVFGTFVIANAVYEDKFGRRRTLGEKTLSFRAVVGRALRAMGLFAVISVMWSLWTSPSVSDWVYLWFKTEISGADVLAFLPYLLLAFGVFLVASFVFERKPPVDTDGGMAGLELPWFRRAAVTTAASLFLFLLGTPLISLQVNGKAPAVMRALQGARLTYQETEMLTRGYYEDLNAANQFSTSQLWELYLKKQNLSWPALRETAAGRTTDTFLRDVILPSASIEFHGAPLTTNRWAMRDQDYEQKKPDNVYRIAMLGASGPFGSGVTNNETFEAVFEERLNLETRGGDYAKYEVLNFSVPGYCPLQQLMLLETKVLSFEPDAVFLIATVREDTSSARHVAGLVSSGIDVRYDFLKRIVARTGIDRHTPFEQAFRRLKRHGEEMLRETYPRFAKICREQGVRPVYLYTPVLQDTVIDRDPGRDARFLALARESGFLVVDVSGAFDGQDTSSLRVAEWDWHPNARAHRLLADRLLQVLRQSDESLGVRFAQTR